MFAVVNHLDLDIPVEELRPGLESEGVPMLASQPGFRGFYLVKAEEKKGIAIILWESGADAANGAKVFGPTWFNANVAPHLVAEQRRSVGPVIVGT